MPDGRGKSAFHSMPSAMQTRTCSNSIETLLEYNRNIQKRKNKPLKPFRRLIPILVPVHALELVDFATVSLGGTAGPRIATLKGRRPLHSQFFQFLR